MDRAQGDGRLPQGLPQGGALQLRQQRPWRHRRQLGRVAHQHEPTPLRQGLEQGLHQSQVHHRHLVHHQQIERERSVPVPSEAIAAALQQAMQGGAGMAGAGGRAQPRRRLAGGCRQVYPGLPAPAFQVGQHPPDGARFAGAGAPLEQHQAVASHRLQGPVLVGIEFGAGTAGGGGLGQGLRLLVGRDRSGAPDQALEHRLAPLPPTAPEEPSVVEHQGAIGGRGQAGSDQGRAMALRPEARIHLGGRRSCQRQFRLAAGQGGGEGPDQLGQSRFAFLLPQTRQRLHQGIGQGRQPGRRILRPATPAQGVHHGASDRPPSAASRASSRASGGRSTIIPGTGSLCGQVSPAEGPGVPRRKM